MEAVTQTAEQFILSQFVVTLIVNVLISGALAQLWNVFNTLQLITALPMFGINTPGNVIAMNKRFMEISNF